MSIAGGCVTGTLGRGPPLLLLLALLLLQLLGASRPASSTTYPVQSFTWDPTRLPQPTCRQGRVECVLCGPAMPYRLPWHLSLTTAAQRVVAPCRAGQYGG